MPFTDTYTYMAFGKLFDHTGITVNSYLYTGQQLNELTVLYNLRVCNHDLSLRRFLTHDTVAINFNNPFELNRYVYAANNPPSQESTQNQEMAILLNAADACAVPVNPPLIHL